MRVADRPERAEELGMRLMHLANSLIHPGEQ
jgi:hypothetical protein